MTRFFPGGRGNSGFFNPSWWGRRSKAGRRRNLLGQELRYSIFQPLEERVMLDIGGANSQPPTIVVGRTLSAYDVPDVQNNQETITLTVYNQAADPITGVLLTDTLASGVSFASASQLPDQNGQQLAWSLGTIQPYDRASVTLTVSLGNPTPTTLDTGASAYGTLDAGMVNWTTAPTTLRTTAISANLLASTPDANTTDPYVQEKAAELNYDPNQIYNFLQTQIGYNSYVGSLRGARGTLWSGAANSLDDASLGVALMRASGIPAQYEEGTLSTAQAQQLILSMFPASYQTVGYIPSATPTSDPANDPQLLSETKDHFWFQFDAGSGMKDADPEVAGQSVGQTATASTNNFTEVPDSLRQKTEIQLQAEITSSAASLFGFGPGTTTVLDQTFNDVDLVGHPLSLANQVSVSGAGAIFSVVTYTYAPYLSITDDAYPDGSHDEVIPGTEFQEAFTTFPLSNQAVTGLFLNVTETGPDGPAQTFEKTLADRIGYDVRHNGGTPNVSITSSTPPIVSPDQVWSISVSGEQQNPSTLVTSEGAHLQQLYETAGAKVSAGDPTAVAAFAQALIGQTQASLAVLLVNSDTMTHLVASQTLTAAYFSRPRIDVISANVVSDTDGTSNLQFEVDLLNDSIRAVVAPGQSSHASQLFQTARGLFENQVEGNVFPQGSAAGLQVPATITASDVLAAAVAQGIGVIRIDPADEPAVDSLAISSVAKARITTALDAGLSVIVPVKNVEIDGSSTIQWFQLNTDTGEITGVAEDGSHSAVAIAGYLAAIGVVVVAINVLFNQIKPFAQAQGKEWADTIYHMLLGPANNAAYAGKYRGSFKEALHVAVYDAEHNPWLLLLTVTGFTSAYDAELDYLYAHQKFSPGDPPAPSLLVNSVGLLDIPQNSDQNPTSVSAGITAGAATGTGTVSTLSVNGSVQASWATEATASLQASSLNAGTATVVSGTGAVIGSGNVTLSSSNSTALDVSGSDNYSVTGVGGLSFYGPAGSALGVSGNWNNYTATLSGNISIKVTTGDLTLNGQSLPAGSYTITTEQATVGGSGTTTEPSFAGSATITGASATVEVGPGTGGVSIGGNALSATSETTLSGYSGTITVHANGNGTDAATLGGSAANVIFLATPSSVTTAGSAAVSFSAAVRTSISDTYNITAIGPAGWSLSVDQSGNVTAMPAPGTSPGSYPVNVVAQSTANPDVTTQATVMVTVMAVTPGVTLAVNPDPSTEVPFQGADLPTAFEATLQNTGPAADTYKLTFSNVPTGFTVLNSGTSVTVPAGQTGILGLYLQPTGTQLPPPGTDLSFTVTAISATNPAIIQTVNVSLKMPTIDAVAIASNPAGVTSTPGSPTTATVTITNVGNVAANAALSTTTDSGLAASGLLTTPVSVAVGQSTKETVTLTPAAGAALDSTLTATVKAGLAATQDIVSVVSVSAAVAGVAGQQNATGGTPAPQSFAAGETVDVTADILAGVLQPRQALASFTITNSSGTTVFTSTPVTIALGALPADHAVDLGTLSTNNLAAGEYSINVWVAETGGQAIAGATGTGTLLINSPVVAGVSIDAEQVAPGTNLVTSTLTVSNQPVLGSVQTDGTASSVAINGTLAYVAGTTDINVVDISNPASPQIVGTFGSGKLISSGANFIQVAGNDLIVATQDQTNPNGFDVLVYTLADRKNPQFAGSLTVPYAFLAGMTVQGTTAYFPTHGIFYDASSGSISAQYGDVVAVDFSNAAAPKFDGVLFNDLGSPTGHNGWESDVVPVTNNLAYMAGSTSTGADTQTGTGRVLVVNTSDPTNLSLSGELDLPGTVQALAIAVDGNTALVVGSSGGLLSPFGDSSNIQLTGNVTLTLLDISNPASPKIIGSTVVTQDTFAASGPSPIGAIDAVSLGNNQFAVNGTILNGAFVVLSVDAGTPANPAISTFTVNSSRSGLAAGGGELFATSTKGLQVLQVNALTTTSVTAEVDVPNSGAKIDLTSFSAPPTRIVPGPNSTALIWKLSLTPGASQQITWQSTTGDLLPGQIQQVATGASLQFTEDGTNQSITLPALNVVAIETPESVQIPLLVRSTQTVAISQASVDAASAGNSQLAGTLSELSDTISQLQTTPTDPNLLSRTQLLLNNLGPELAADPALAGFVSQLAPIQADAKSGDVTDMLAALPTFFKNVDAVLAVEATEQFTVSVSPGEVDLPALANQQKSLSVTLTDTGPDPVRLTLSTGTLPSGVTAMLGQSQVTLQPGASQTVPLMLTSNLVSTHIFTLDVHAADSADSTLATVAKDGTAIVAVRAAAADVLGVTVNPISVTSAGTPIAVSASIFDTANATRSIEAQLTVLDSTNKPVGSPTDVPITLTPTASAVTFPLGDVDTTGLANGVYTLEVSLLASDGSTLPGKTSEAPFLVGIPISASVSASPSTLPPGTSTVTTTISVANTDPPAGQSPPVNQPSGNTSSQTNNTNNNNTGNNNASTPGGNTTPPPNTTPTPPATPQIQAVDPPADPPAPPTPPTFSPPSGDAVKWIGTASGKWDVAANWLDTTTNTNHVPDATDNVTIDASGLTITVEAGNQVAQSLLVKSGSTLDVQGGNLSVSSGAEIDGTVDLSGNSTLAMGGGATVTGSLSWADSGVLNLDGGNLFNTGTMSLSGTVYLDSRSPTDTLNLKGTFYNEGTVQQSGELYLYDSATLNNTSLGTWQFTSDVGIHYGSFTPVIVNSGLFQKTAGTGTSSLDLSMTNTGGTFEADSGTLELADSTDSFTGGAFNAQTGGTVWLNEGTTGMTFSGSFTGTGAGTVLLDGGSIDLAGDTTFNFSPGLFQWYNSTINLAGYNLTNAGTLTLGLVAQGTNEAISSADASNNPLGGTFENNGTLTLQGSSGLYLYDRVVLDNSATGSLLFAGGANGDPSLLVGNDTPSFTNEGTIEKTSGAGTSQIGVPFTYTGGPIKVDSGTLTLDPSSAQIAGTSFTVAAGATLELAGNTSGNVFSGTFTGTGGGTVLLENGSIVVGSGGATFNFPTGMFQWTGGGINLDGHTLTNTGSITLANANNVSLFGDGNFPGGPQNGSNQAGTFNNQGALVEQAAGWLGLYDSVSFDNQASGTYNLASDAGIYYGSGAIYLSNAGLIDKSAGSGTSDIEVALNNSAKLEVDSGTLSLQGNGGTSTGGTFTVANGSTLVLAGNNTNGDAFTGTYTGSGGGTVTIGSGSIDIGTGGATFNFPAGMFQWTDGGINLDGNTLTNVGSMTVANPNNVSLYGNGNFPGGSQKGGDQGGTLDNQGTIADQGPAGIYLYDGIVVKNEVGASLSLTGGASLIYENYSSAVNNAGTLNVNGVAATSTISAPLTNSGAVTVASGELDLTSTVTNNGTLDAQANTLKFTGPVANHGTIQTAGGTLAFDEQNDQSEAVSNAGTIQVNGGTATFSGPVTQDAGGYLSGGTWVVEGGGTIVLPANSNITVNEGKIVLNGAGSTMIGIGSLARNDGALTITSGATLTTTGDFTNDGALTLGGGSTSGTLRPAESTALAFNGSSDFVHVGNLGARPTQGTISFWMKPSTVSSYQNVLTTGPTNSNNAGGNQAIRFEEVGQSLYAVFGSDTAADNGSSGLSSFLLTNSLTPGAWVDVAVTWDSSTNQVTGYLNGTQVFSSTNTNFPSNFGNVSFGLGYSSNPSDQRYYNGLLSDVRFYNVERSQANIQSDMTKLLTGSEAGLIGYWPLNDGSGTTAADLTANHNNGTLGSGTAADEPAWIATDVALGIGGNFTQDPGGTLDVQLGGTPASGRFGQLVATGTATFAGMLRSQFTGGYAPTAGDNFTVASYASATGSFGEIDLAESPTVAYSANVGTSSLVLQSQAATLTPTQTSVTSSAPNGASYGQLVEYTATVTASAGTPIGSVEFQIDGVNYGTPIAIAGGQATLTVALPAGTHSIVAFYISGNSQFANSDDSASPLTQVINAATVTPSSIELYYTTYGGPASVDKVAVSLSQGNLTLGTPTPIVQNLPADGLIFLPNGNLLTADGAASEVNPTTGAVTTENQVNGAHLALDPSGQYVWTSPQPGPLYKLPIDPLGPATQETLTGDDTTVTHLAFDSAGQAFYVSSGPGGFGSFGLIDLTTFTTQRIYSNLPAAHGITYDPFTGDLFLVGADSVAQIDPNTLKIVSELDFPGSGFTFDQGAEDGKGHLYAADNGGHLLVVDYSATGLIGDPRNFVASPFLANALDDVAPLSGLGGAGIPITVTHQLPATGYNVNPTSITPNPSSFSSSEVTWNTTFTPGEPETDQFQLTGQVTNMAPGEVRQISDGTTVTATVTAADGTQIPVSINLPPVTVAAQHIIELTPPTETVDQGATATYTVELSNPLPTAETYTLSIAGLPTGENATLAASVPVPAGQTVDVPLTISVPVGALQGTQAFLVSAETLEGASDSVEGQLTVTSAVVTNSLAVNLSLAPTQAVAGQTNPATYTLTVTNTGDTTDTYNLSAALPQGFTGTFSQTSITVPPGLSNFRDVQFSITPPAGATAQSYPFTVTATSTTDGTVSSQASGTANVLAQGVQVQLTPSSAVPGSTYQLKVTNTGQTADTFNLSLGSPGALVATLGTNQVTLQPGASQTVPVTTTAANFADAGTLPLTGIATSQTNSSVQAQSTADLSIPSTQSMTAAFNPTQQTLVVPGDTSFLLQVNNTGNTEDSYSATIVGTTGPVTASLVGLDGQPMQSVPLFILPGLSTGAILLQVNDTGTGQGTVTVLVQSLTNSSIQAAPTATITVPVPTVPPPSLTLTNDIGAAATEGSSTVLTNAMLQATDSDTSVKAANIVYTLTAVPTQGTLSLGGQALAAGGTFTQDDINSGRMAYKSSEEGADFFGFSVSATGAATLTGTFLIAASDPAVIPTGGFTVNAVEGANSAVQTVATFTDPGGFASQASYTAEINWGDGTQSAGTIVLPAAGATGPATVTGQHTYVEEGNYTLSIAVAHEGAPIATATAMASVSDPAVAASGGFAFSGTAGGAATAQTVAVFTDPGGAEAVTDYSATIDWGDGSSATSGQISVTPATGVFTVAGQHVYASPGDFPIHVTISHETAPSVTVTAAAAIAATGTAPILTLVKDAGAAATEGSSVGISDTMLQTTDSDSSVSAAHIVYTVTAAPTQGTLLLSGQPLTDGGTFTQDDINSGRLAYKATEEGADAFSFQVAAAGALGISGTFLIATSDPAVVATGGFTFTASEGSASAVETVATFTDPGGFEPQASYSAEINWGDGTSGAGTIILPATGQTAATVTGQHAYAEEGNYSIQITLHHEGAAAATATSSAVVSDPAVAATGGFTYSGTEASTGSAQTVAVFTDPGGAEAVGDYSATINWGDGTSATAGVITLDAATDIFTVSGQHNYSQDGTYSVKVTLTHESAPAVTVTGAAQIANASTTGGPGIAATALTVTGYEFSTLTSVSVATFTDGNASLPAADFSATIDWGDGRTSAGSVALTSGIYTVSGSHEYTDEGHDTVKVSIDQTAGPTAGGATSGTVSAAATIHEQLLANGTVGTPNQNWVQEVYRDLFDRQAELQGLDYWVAELTQGVSRGEVAYQMVQIASFEEFQHDTVVALYQQYLGRAPDTAGEAYWTAYLYDGGTIAGMSQALVSSPEFYSVRGGGTVDGFLKALFQDALGRPIDASALAHFGTQMAQGATAADVADVIFASDEYHRVRVNALFEQLLDRPADPGALTYYAGELDNGASEELVVSQLTSSDEYFERANI
jgi:uncharacterized repeat protein (TIGR01451 family)